MQRRKEADQLQIDRLPGLGVRLEDHGGLVSVRQNRVSSKLSGCEADYFHRDVARNAFPQLRRINRKPRRVRVRTNKQQNVGTDLLCRGKQFFLIVCT